jgi:ABC-type phosphate transport system auxiliary subunit
MREFEEALALVEERLDEADFEAQPEERVSRAEQTLGVRFPPTYRRFLIQLGAGGVGGEEIYGLVNDDFEDVRPPQAVGLTLQLRREGQIGDALVVICNLGQGSHYALNTARAGPDGEASSRRFHSGLEQRVGRA